MLSDRQKKLIQDFRDKLEARVEQASFAAKADRLDRQDDSTLSSRFAAGPHVWYELTVRPFLPQIRVGLITDDPYRSRDFKQMIDQSSLTCQEFVQLGFEAADLTWPEPPVERYRDHREHFYFATPVDIASLEVLNEPSMAVKCYKMLLGYHLAFTGRGA